MRATMVLVMLVGTAAMAACAGSGSTQPTPAPAPPTSTEAAAPAPAGEREAIDTYNRMWDAFSSASATSDWKSPDLARYSSGYALDQLVQSLQTDQAVGVVTVGTFTTNPVVVSADPKDAPTVARLQDCGDDSQTKKVRASDKKELPDGPKGGRHRIDAEVRRDGGVWKVVDFRLRAAGTC